MYVRPKVCEKYLISRGDKMITMYSSDSHICTNKKVRRIWGERAKVKSGQQARVRTGHSQNGCRQVEIEIGAFSLSPYYQKYFSKEASKSVRPL